MKTSSSFITLNHKYLRQITETEKEEKKRVEKNSRIFRNSKIEIETKKKTKINEDKIQ